MPPGCGGGAGAVRCQVRQGVRAGRAGSINPTAPSPRTLPHSSPHATFASACHILLHILHFNWLHHMASDDVGGMVHPALGGPLMTRGAWCTRPWAVHPMTWGALCTRPWGTACSENSTAGACGVNHIVMDKMSAGPGGARCGHSTPFPFQLFVNLPPALSRNVTPQDIPT